MTKAVKIGWSLAACFGKMSGMKDLLMNRSERPAPRHGGLWIELLFILISLTFFAGMAHKWLLVSSAAPVNTGWSQIESSGETSTQIGNLNILFLGLDSADDTHRSDTIFVLGVNPAKNRITMVSIPRDTRVLLDGRPRKINEIFPRYGAQALSSLIEDLMGIKISRYVRVDFNGFAKVIDALGGVEVEIDRPMHYDDNYGKVHIHFDPGKHHLDGQQALNYVRFRGGPTADLGRIRRQQRFIKVLIEKGLSPSSYPSLPQAVREVFAHFETDFSASEIIALIRGFESLKPSIQTASLPGEARYIDRISYFLPYRDKAAELGAAFFSDLAAIELVASFSSTIEPEESAK